MANRVHPNSSVLESARPTLSTSINPMALTVWRKSLLFNCNGFTVFDSKGNLIFRVDEYARSSSKGGIVLMNAVGTPLLTIRRKKLSLGEHWQIYEGEAEINPLFSVRKQANFIIQSKSLAHVNPFESKSYSCEGGEGLVIEGSYLQRCCEVYDKSRKLVAEIRPKESAGGVTFGIDVFRLIVHPGLDAAVAMAIVILLQEMFGSKTRSIVRI